MDNARREYVVDLRIDRITTELLNTQSLRCTKGDPRMNGNNWRSPPAGIRCALDKGKVKMEQRPSTSPRVSTARSGSITPWAMARWKWVRPNTSKPSGLNWGSIFGEIDNREPPRPGQRNSESGAGLADGMRYGDGQLGP